MNFPTSIVPDMNTRAGRMLAAGRVKVTVTQGDGEHITILFKSFADNRERQYQDVSKRWVACPLHDATHVFAEVPNASGEWNDKIGTFYPLTTRWYSADNADARRVNAAAIAAHWLAAPGFLPDGVKEIVEQSECARCGKELTDPESIRIGIGPVCLGKMETGSQHQVKERIERAINDTGDANDWTPEDLPEDFDHGTPEVPDTVEEVQQMGLVDTAFRPMGLDLDSMTDGQIESIIAVAQRVLFKRQFAREERVQEEAAFAAKTERDTEFLGR